MAEPAVQNHPETTEGGATGAGFIKGQPSANPGGRPKGIARLARELTGNDGELILRFYAAAMGGRMTNPDYDPGKEKGADNPEHVAVSERGRLEAAKLLAERGFGKAPQFAPIEDEDPLDFSEAVVVGLADELDARLDEVAAARKRREATAAASA